MTELRNILEQKLKKHLIKIHLKQMVKRESKLIAISLSFGVLVSLLWSCAAYSDSVVDGISDKVIRFHVLANSDSEADQLLKLAVRDAVLSDLGGDIKKLDSLEETRAFLEQNFGRIKQTAEKTISDNGKDYKVNVSLEKTMFPTKSYGDISLVAGTYEALRIQIGSAEGKNWWCVVYPPLCYVDAAKCKVDSAETEKLKSSLDEEKYGFVVKNDDLSYTVKFKMVELFQEGRQMLFAKK